jgi:hypothetical protein
VVLIFNSLAPVPLQQGIKHYMHQRQNKKQLIYEGKIQAFFTHSGNGAAAGGKMT